jgi:8-oxo-dGTP pyrophosphatase MutT (NUDIX family)
MAQLKHGFERFEDRPGAPLNALRHAVAARTAVDARERDSIATFLTTIDTLDHPFDEHAAPTHVTGSAIVTSAAGVVLHLHKRLSMWLQPGGHIDDGEEPWEAALREAREETGLPIVGADTPPELMHVDVHPGPRGHTHLDLRYHFTSPPVDPAPPAGESPEVRWFSWPQAIAMAEPGLEGVLRFAQPGRPTIRPAVVADASDCARVYLRSNAFDVTAPPESRTEAEVARWMADEAIPGMDMWVADLDGVVVGHVVRARDGRHDPASDLISDPIIDPSWTDRGLDDALGARAT